MLLRGSCGIRGGSDRPPPHSPWEVCVFSARGGVPHRGLVDIPMSENVWNGNGNRKTDECFANWDDEVNTMLTVTPNSESALLDAWAQEDVRRREELESMVSNMDQPEEQEMGLESLQRAPVRSW
jgi:hypothetical protein